MCRPGVGTRACWVVACFLLLSTPAAYATSQCPPEYGHKPEWISWLAIGVLGVGLIAGPLLGAGLFVRSKGARSRWRALAAVGGVALMLGVWTVCGVVAGHLIMQC